MFYVSQRNDCTLYSLLGFSINFTSVAVGSPKGEESSVLVAVAKAAAMFLGCTDRFSDGIFSSFFFSVSHCGFMNTEFLMIELLLYCMHLLVVTVLPWELEATGTNISGAVHTNTRENVSLPPCLLCTVSVFAERDSTLLILVVWMLAKLLRI